MEKAVKHCSNCSTKYTVEWNEEEQDLEPLTCPFCGFEVEEELDGEPEIPEEAEHDS
jgi:DNA-directed RNA polymerase subunit RPC12/RpoP